MTSSEPRTCQTCGALMGDAAKHEQWHREQERRERTGAFS